MLVSLVVQLRPLAPGSLLPYTGKAVGAFLLNWLQEVDPALSAALHDMDEIKPLTASGVQRAVRPDSFLPPPLPPGELLKLDPQRLYWFRITSLHEELSMYLLENFYLKPPQTIPILRQNFKVEGVAVRPEEHPWAANCSWSDLKDTALAGYSEDFSQSQTTRAPGSKITLLFHTPTTFQHSGRAFPLPLPAQAFRSLVDRWNAFSGALLDDTVYDAITDDVAISAYDLRTELVQLEGSRQGTKLLGCRGWCEYSYFGQRPEQLLNLHLLSRFAFFSGVGKKTLQGFGQILAVEGIPKLPR